MIDRVTFHVRDGIAVTGVGKIYDPAKRKTRTMAGAVIRLSEYEDTGLDPCEIVKLKAERDAAIRDFTEYTQAWWNEERRFPCEWCKHNDTPYCRSIEKINSGNPCAGRFFIWRGPQQEETT